MINNKHEEPTCLQIDYQQQQQTRHRTDREREREIGAFHTHSTTNLLLFLALAGVDLEVLELKGALRSGDHVQVVAQLLLLQVLLGQVLEVSLGKGQLGSDQDLGLVARDHHLGSEVSSLAAHLDAVVQILLEGGGVDDLVLHGLVEINGELGNSLLSYLLHSLLQSTTNYRVALFHGNKRQGVCG